MFKSLSFLNSNNVINGKIVFGSQSLTYTQVKNYLFVFMSELSMYISIFKNNVDWICNIVHECATLPTVCQFVSWTCSAEFSFCVFLFSSVSEVKELLCVGQMITTDTIVPSVCVF